MARKSAVAAAGLRILINGNSQEVWQDCVDGGPINANVKLSASSRSSSGGKIEEKVSPISPFPLMMDAFDDALYGDNESSNSGSSSLSPGIIQTSAEIEYDP